MSSTGTTSYKANFSPRTIVNTMANLYQWPELDHRHTKWQSVLWHFCRAMSMQDVDDENERWWREGRIRSGKMISTKSRFFGAGVSPTGDSNVTFFIGFRRLLILPYIFPHFSNFHLFLHVLSVYSLFPFLHFLLLTTPLFTSWLVGISHTQADLPASI